MNCDPNLADNYTPRQSFYIDQSIINPWLENFPRQESWLRNLLQVWLQKELAQTEAAFSIAIQRIVHAHGLRTYAVSPHIEILIRGNCESLFPSCVPRIRYDAMPRTSCHRDFLSRQQCNTKRFTRLRVYIYIFFSYFSPRLEENSMGIWATRARVIGFLAARNSMTLFIPYSSNLPTCHPPSAGQTMRIR